MRSLFLKIFLSYWAAQALFVVLAILVTSAIHPQDSPRFEYFRTTMAEQAAQAFDRGGEAELRKYMEVFERSLHTHAFLFDTSGRELSGRSAPDWARNLAVGAPPGPSGIWGWLVSDRRVSQAITGPTGQRFVLVFERPVTPRLWFSPSRAPGVGILVAILSSGLVCFFLARYLTLPVVRLRAATQRLASGDLTARAGGTRNSGSDEIGQLVRDFDGMAGRLESLVNAQSRLLNDISHELRSPLARLNVALGLARQRTGPEADSAINRIELEANRLNELIGRLLVLARMEGGEDPVEGEPVQLDELVREIVKDAEFEAQGRNCRVRFEMSDQPVVMGTAALLHSAIENVVRNAMRYTGEGTQVEVRLDQVNAGNGPEAVIRVSDQGPGVPEAALDKLFRPFYRIDDARVRQTGGVGLGLSITDRAVRLHRGSVKAANRPGGGLVVEIRLPVISPTIAADLREATPLPISEPSSARS
jgi:two-component system, OmpR family, sensor histidine kinase CpxA